MDDKETIISRDGTTKTVLEIGSWGTDCEFCYCCEHNEGELGCALASGNTEPVPSVTHLFFSEDGKVYCAKFDPRVMCSGNE